VPRNGWQGNHAQAIALACRLLGVPVTVVMPTDAPSVKYDATAAYGAEIIQYDRQKIAREALTDELISQHGYTLVPPFDSEYILAGQGTAVKELVEDTGELDYVITPCGGGGLLSGSAISAKHALPNCRVIGVEPEIADDGRQSLRSGKIVAIPAPETIADGLRTTSLGKITFPLIQEYVDDIITVSEDEIIRTMYFLWTRMKLVVEPSGAAGLSATLATLVSLEGTRFRLVVAEGENLDSQELPALEMPYGQFRPDSGLRDCLNGWLAAGGPHHEVMNLGRHAADWQVFCQLAGIEYVAV